ncbi:UNVERIFIED_CONTAM: hypothetical protein Scaly_2165400 [Sesamum calycinum]|uniref:Uncharacterized protein n=1 Tax=Sesamum calycinum TaxID=2727403 RepID=A0AAW2MMD1_9LAMI
MRAYVRDDIGIGGSWSEFVDYVTTSLKSGDVKLVMEDLYESGGASHAKLIAQKAKGMPLSISLGKLVNSAASEAMANLSLELYKEFKDVQCSLIEGHLLTELLKDATDFISKVMISIRLNSTVESENTPAGKECHSPEAARHAALFKKAQVTEDKIETIQIQHLLWFHKIHQTSMLLTTHARRKEPTVLYQHIADCDALTVEER